MPQAWKPRLDLYEVPKPGGGVRVLSILDPTTSRRYEDLTRAAAPVGGGAVRGGGLGVGLGPEGLAAERARWGRAVARAVASGVAIGSDVRSCFPSIGPNAVGVGLSSAGGAPRDVASLQTLLREVGRAGIPGLPVGPSPSAVVAEAVLRVGDTAVLRAGGTIVRWVDDVVIAGVDRVATLRAFDAWVRCLRDLGLEPHDGKTSILEPSMVPGIPSGLLPSSRGMMRAP